jgi:transposase
MGNPRGVKRDFEALEKRRFQALKLLNQGYNQSEVARRVKVCSQTVSRWSRAVSKRGEKALRAAGRAGRKPQLDGQQREKQITRLIEGPERLGYETPLWTRKAFRPAEIVPLCPDFLSQSSGVRRSHCNRFVAGIGS